jgi:flagellar protein FliS
MKTMVDARRSYQESALRGATPIELVVVLYDTAIEDMRHALMAMQQNDVESRSRYIGHALIVLQQLQGTLDFERGGSAARQFEQFYNLIRAKLLEAQILYSAELVREQIRYFCEVRDCWMQAKRTVQPEMGPGAAPSTLDNGMSAGGRNRWSA